MKKRYALLCLLIGLVTTAHGQTYQWITGGGSGTDMSPSANLESVEAMCTDANRNVYIMSPVGDYNITTDTLHLGSSPYSGTSNAHTLVASYDCAGHVRWAKVVDALVNTAITGIVYSKGSVYLTGYLYGGQQRVGTDSAFDRFNLVSYLLRIDTSGQFKWIRFTGTDVANNSNLTGVGFNRTAHNVAIDGQGNIHHYDNTATGALLMAGVTSVYGTYDLKYDMAGNLLSAVRLAIDSTERPFISDCVINPVSGNLYATVLLTDTSSATGQLENEQTTSVMAFDKLGNVLWKDTAYFPNFFSGLAYDGNNNLYTTAVGAYSFPFKTSFGSQHVAITDTGFAIGCYNGILTLDTLGNLKRNTHVSIRQAGSGSLTKIARLGDDKLALTGIMVYGAKYGTDSLPNVTAAQQPWMAVFDTLGTLKYWSYDTGTQFYNWGTAVATNSAGDVYIGGMVSYDLHVPGLANYYTTGGNTDFFVKKYGFGCDCATAPVAAFSYTGATTVAFTYTGSTPYDSLLWSFGDGTTSQLANPSHTYTGTGPEHVCVTAYSDCGTTTFCQDINAASGIGTVGADATVRAYPSPAGKYLSIEHAAVGSKALLFTIVGQQVRAVTVTNPITTLTMDGLSPGMYMLEVTDMNGVRVRQRIQKE